MFTSLNEGFSFKIELEEENLSCMLRVLPVHKNCLNKSWFLTQVAKPAVVLVEALKLLVRICPSKREIFMFKQSLLVLQCC